MYVLNCATYEWSLLQTTGQPPLPRNGHTLTYALGQLVVIGGWLGEGPYAASDLFTFNVSKAEWNKPETNGTPPGPSNMHTADWIEEKQEIFLFRGGDGKIYDNSVSAFNVSTSTWRSVETAGEKPTIRANHASCVVGSNLFIFGGWNGKVRNATLHVLDTSATTPQWSTPSINGSKPMPRAGCTITSIRGMVFLFGGSGPADSFNDFYVYNPATQEWKEAISGHVDSKGGEIPVEGAWPEARGGHAAAVYGNKLLVIGGAKSNGRYYDNCYELDFGKEPGGGCCTIM